MDRCSTHCEKIQLYCKECDTPVCNTCITTRHSGHRFKKLSEVKEAIFIKVEEAKKENARNKGKLERDLRNRKYEIRKQHRNFSKNCQETENRKKELKRKIDKQWKQYEEKCRNHHDKIISDLQKKCDHLKQDMKELSQYEATLNRIMNTDKVSDLIREFEQLRAPVTHDIGVSDTPPPCTFVPGKSYEEMFGHVDELTVEDRYESIRYPVSTIAQPIEHDDGAYASMTPSGSSSISVTSESANERELVYDRARDPPAIPQGIIANISRQKASYISLSANDDQCWVKYHNRNKITLINRFGKEMKEPISFSNRICGFSYYLDDKLLVCLPEMKTIRQVDRYSSFDFISTGSFIPRCVYSSRFDDAIVAILEDPGSTRDPANCELVRYKGTDEKKRVRNDQFGNDLFYSSDKIYFNRTGNRIAVINTCGPTSTHLVILSKNLELLWRYFGDGRAYQGHVNIDRDLLQKDTNMCLTDVVFDYNHNIIIADRFTNTVKMLNHNMEPLSVLGTFNESPAALSMVHCNQTLWIMFDSGNLSVVNHRVPSSSH